MYEDFEGFGGCSRRIGRIVGMTAGSGSVVGVGVSGFSGGMERTRVGN